MDTNNFTKLMANTRRFGGKSVLTNPQKKEKLKINVNSKSKFAYQSTMEPNSTTQAFWWRCRVLTKLHTNPTILKSLLR